MKSEFSTPPQITFLPRGTQRAVIPLARREDFRQFWNGDKGR